MPSLLLPWMSTKQSIDKMYNKLVEYKQSNNGSIDILLMSGEEYSNCKIKHGTKGEVKLLRSWCNSQTQQLLRWSHGHIPMLDAGTWYGPEVEKKLSEERIDKLKSIDFPIPPSYDEMYTKLATHKNQTGALDVNKEEDPELFAWAVEQKRMLAQHFGGKQVSLSQQQVQDLTSLGFTHGRVNNNGRQGVVDTGLVEKKWDSMLEGLVKYREDHGGSIVFPNKNKSTLLTKSERSVKTWLEKQRKEYKLLQQGKASTMTARRIQRFTAAIGLEKLAPQRVERVSWEERMQQMREFVTEHGHCKPTRAHAELGEFAKNMRTYYRWRQEGKASCLTDQRIVSFYHDTNCLFVICFCPSLMYLPFYNLIFAYCDRMTC